MLRYSLTRGTPKTVLPLFHYGSGGVCDPVAVFISVEREHEHGAVRLPYGTGTGTGRNGQRYGCKAQKQGNGCDNLFHSLEPDYKECVILGGEDEFLLLN